jgi:DNA polymerase-3 subunit gamma/tau
MADDQHTGELVQKFVADNPGVSAREYVVVARRYRPQDFSQLIGQDQVSQALANAITTNRVGHAYLFTGARGVGKTSTARIFAKALNCVNGPTTTPCGVCDICAGIASGSDVDVIEIDGASNRGIDEIRQLRSNVNVRPSRARFKIYIIDEVHMLTTPAFNALLKTLEEPPEHVKFIFCTTEADRIPITVLSRCQRFDFAPIEMRSIVERLQHICQTEGVQAEPEALQIIARRAAGSMRDSQSLLEQLLSFGGDKITVADVHSLLGTAHSARLAALADCIARRDAAVALKEVETAISEGVDVGALAEQLLGYFRDCLAAFVGCSSDLLLHTSAAEQPHLQALGQQLGLETLLAMAQILDQTLIRLRQTTHARTLVELALVRLCKLDDLDALPNLLAELRGQGTGDRGQGTGTRSMPSGPVLSTKHSVPGTSLTAATGLDDNPKSKIQNPKSADLEPSPPPAPQKKTPENLEREPTAPTPDALPLDDQAATVTWRQTLTEIGDMTADFAARAERIAISAPNRLVVSFRKAYTQAQQYCERPERRQKLEQTFSRLAGRNIRIDFATLPDESLGQPDERPAQKPPVNRRQRQQELMRHPLIRKAAELFDTEIIAVLEASAADESGETPARSASDGHRGEAVVNGSE